MRWVLISFAESNTVSLRQFFAGLFRYDIRGVPVGPVRVALPGPPLVLAVGGFRTPKRTCQIVHRGERGPAEAMRAMVPLRHDNNSGRLVIRRITVHSA